MRSLPTILLIIPFLVSGPLSAHPPVPAPGSAMHAGSGSVMPPVPSPGTPPTVLPGHRPGHRPGYPGTSVPVIVPALPPWPSTGTAGASYGSALPSGSASYTIIPSRSAAILLPAETVGVAGQSVRDPQTGASVPLSGPVLVPNQPGVLPLYQSEYHFGVNRPQQREPAAGLWWSTGRSPAGTPAPRMPASAETDR